MVDYTSDQLWYQQGHGFRPGQPLFIDEITAKHALAQANTSARARVVGVVSSYIDPNRFLIARRGEVIENLSNLVAGRVYYLSDETPGGVTADEPADNAVEIYQAVSTTSAVVLMRETGVSGGSGAESLGDFQAIAEKNQDDGYAGLGATGKLNIGQFPTSGVTADTYPYPSSISVDQYGRVTEVAPGTGTGVFDEQDVRDIIGAELTNSADITFAYDSVAETITATFTADMATQAELDAEAATRAADDSTLAGEITAHLTDAVDAHDASAISNIPAGNIASTDVQAALNELDTEKATTGSVATVASDLAAHLADTSDAHDASAISNVPAGNIASTDVQAALNELDTEKATTGSVATVAAGLAAHIANATAAHAASAISNTPAGNIAATDVQGALNELDTEKATTGSVSTVAADLAAHIAETTDAHDASAISYDNTTSMLAATDVQAAIDEIVAGGGGGTYTDEDAQDAVGGILGNTADITFDYDDAGNAITATFTADMATQAELDAEAGTRAADDATNASDIATVASDLADHLADATAAHAASAISNVAAGNISSTDVQAAINELDTEKASIAYVDAVAQSLSIKHSCRVATAAALATNSYLLGVITETGNGALTVDGIAVDNGDRVLVKDEIAGANNGIYDVTDKGSAGTPFVLTRSSDMNADAEVAGAFTFIEDGTANESAGFVVASDGPFTLGTTTIAWTQFSGAGEITAGAALTKTGNTLDVAVDNSSIEVSSDALRVKALGITSGMLTGSIAASKLAAMSSADLAGILTDETGSGALVFATSPTLVTPLLGTPTSGTLTNCTGLTEAGLTLANNTTANVTTSAHGFCPILPNDSAKFLNGVGAWATIAGGSLADGDYGDIVVSSSGAAINIDSGVLTTAGRNFVGLTSIISEIDSLHTTSTDIASASTTDLSTATGIYVTITGTTTITAFGTCAAGVLRILKFTSQVTLTHNATSLILPGASSQAALASDVVTFVSLGSGNWRCIDWHRGGSVPYNPASVAITGGNINNVTIGGTTPAGIDTILLDVHNVSEPPQSAFAFTTSFNICIVGATNAAPGIHAEAYGTSGTARAMFEGMYAGGSYANPSNVTGNAILAEMAGGGLDSSGAWPRGNARYFFAARSATSWTSSTHACYHAWYGTPVAATTAAEWMRLDDTNLLVGGTSAMTGTGGVHIFGTTDASSSTTGALLVDGGVGIAKALDVGTTLTVGTTSTLNGDVTIADAKNVILNTTTGTKFGTGTTQKLAFYGSVPVVQRSGSAEAAVGATGATNSSPFGYTTSTQANAIVTLVNEIRATLVALGLMKGSA